MRRVILALPFLLPVAAPAATVIVDGDTVRIDGETIRIANIDAPETRDAKCDAEKRLGLVAKRRLGELIGSGRVTVTPGDPGTHRLRDRRGRLLATIQVDGADVGLILIAEGLARPWEGKRRPWCLNP